MDFHHKLETGVVRMYLHSLLLVRLLHSHSSHPQYSKTCSLGCHQHSNTAHKLLQAPALQNLLHHQSLLKYGELGEGVLAEILFRSRKFLE